MRIDRSGWPFISSALVVAMVVGLTGGPLWALPFVVLASFFLFFFRDPDRRPPASARDVVSPADGRVLVAGKAAPQIAPPGAWQQLSIFLSPLDVHVNRIPVSGLVSRVDYRPGRFLPAYRREAAEVNERNEIWLDHNGQIVVCRQIVGVLARRIRCRIGPGARVATGERFGIMKFGSRVDLFLPPDATLRVRVGDRVRGGETVVATLGTNP
ncbi:MAG: phosphatidylserine decarboxylase family protein [Acidobacteria bacterium]|nr:phosphatidylserine decarboxylase family protein [Acidobacteriota bacterium]